MKWFLRLNTFINMLITTKWKPLEVLFISMMVSVILVCRFNWLSTLNTVILFSTVMGFWMLFCIIRVVYLVLMYKIVVKDGPTHE